jgi:dTDP-4-amino-4,6-dideoxygalactose transaminase
MGTVRKVGLGCPNIDDLARQYVAEVLETGRLSSGPFTRRLELMIASLHSRRFAIFCSSGTSALRASIACLKELDEWSPGSEVIVPSLTFVATANVVIDHGFVPVFCDVDPRTYNIDPAQIESLITERTRAIMPVHLMGLPCDMDPIMEIAARHQLRVIEDSCEAMFVGYKNRPVGSFGDIACFSTYMAHLLTTGVGGFAATNDSEIAVVIKSLFNHGRDGIYTRIDDDQGKGGEDLLEVVQRRFRFVRPGYSFRATEMEAALGLAHIERWREMIRARQHNAEFLSKGLADLTDRLQLPWKSRVCDHAYMMYPITVKEEYSKELPKAEFTLHLEEHGIETRDILPLINQPFYVERFGDLEARLPVARWVNRNGFYIGCHQQLDPEDLEHMVDTIRSFVQERLVR